MSTDAPGPGWYPDPAGAGGRRYWDGRAWTEHVSTGTWAGGISQPALPEGARVSTVFIWLYVLLPLVSILLTLLQDPAAQMRRAIEQPRAPFVPFADPGVLLGQLLGFVVYGGSVLLAFLDWSALKRLGVVRPFHWAFAFIPVPVYIIGRTVVLNRRVHRGSAPLWVYLALVVLTWIVSGIVIAQAFATIAPLVVRSAGTT